MSRYFSFITIVFQLFICVIKAESADKIPTTGNFFYSEVYYNKDNAQSYYIRQGLGCDNFEQKWLVSTTEEAMGFVTTNCISSCTVPRKFNMPNNVCAQSLGNFYTEHAFLYDRNNYFYQDRVLQGFSAYVEMNFTLLSQRRQYTHQFRSFSVDQSNNFKFDYKDYSGYIGLAPFTFQPD